MKGVSTIIVTVLLVIIVVSVVGLSYTFFTSILSTTTQAAQTTTSEKVKGLMKHVRILSMSLNDVYIRNMGMEDISEVDVIVDGKPVNYVLEPPFIEPDRIGIVKIIDFIEEGDEVKIGSGLGMVSIEAPDPCKEAVLCLDFDEGFGRSVLDSANGNDGVFYGENFNDGTIYEAQRIDGKHEKGLEFDGVDDYVDCGTDPSLEFRTSDFTLAVWVKLDILSKIHYVMRTSTGGYGYRLFVNAGNEVCFMIAGEGAEKSFCSLSTLSAGDWYFITAVRNSSSQRGEIYINGVLDNFNTSQVWDNNITNSLSLGIGGTYPSGYFNGTIDEVRIFNQTLTQAEIQAEMQSSLPVERPVASYSFEDTDTPGYANDTHIWVKGKYGSALSFDGVDDYVDISNPNSVLPGVGSMTIVGWVRGTSSDTSFDRFYHIRDINGVGGRFIYAGADPTNNGKLRARFDDGTNLVAYTFSDIEWLDGTWHHVAIVYDRNDNRMKAYLDGVKSTDEYDISSVSNSISTTNNFYFGHTGGGDPFNGTIESVRIYNKAID